MALLDENGGLPLPGRKDRDNQRFMRLIRAAHSLATTDDIEKSRASQVNMGLILGTKSKDCTYTELNIHDVPAEVVQVNRPHSKKNIILYCHGGGYNTGSVQYARILTTKLAIATSMDVISFDYRLSPEFPHPAALNDATKVWDYLMLQGYGSRDIVIAGDSAGGNLALALGLKLKQDQRFLPRCFICMSPWTDLTCSGSSYEKKKELDPILNWEYIDRARSDFAPDNDYSNPLISPLFGDYTDFPPVYIQVGNNEILLSDSINLQKKLQKQDVDARIDIYKQMWHVFQMSNFKAANDAMDKIAAYIIEKLQ